MYLPVELYEITLILSMTSYVNLIPLEKDKPRTPTHQEILIYKLERSLLFFCLSKFTNLLIIDLLERS